MQSCTWVIGPELAQTTLKVYPQIRRVSSRILLSFPA